MTAITLSPEHLERDLTARLLDRLASQCPRATQLLETLGLANEPRLAAAAGLVLVGAQADPAALARKALSAIGQGLDRPVKENPPATAIAAGDLVLLHQDARTVAEGKPALTRFERQLQALEHAGALAVIVLEDVGAWPPAARQKMIAALQKHPCPRLMACFSLADEASAPSLPWLAKCQHVTVGEEAPALRRRVAP